jgi:16S rRNA (cytosine1402-N4)-methyltransferase
VDWLLENYRDVIGVGDDPDIRPGIMHRLDRDTSGVMVVAKNQATFEYLKSLFQERKIIKKYIVLVYGLIKKREGIIDQPIGIKSGTIKRTTFSSKMEKKAITEYKLVSSMKHSFVAPPSLKATDGHSKALAEILKGDCTIIGIDQDNEALKRAEVNLLGKVKKLILKQGNFRKAKDIVCELGFSKKVNSALLDLGISSDQLEISGRGFSFQRDEPLLMTLSEKSAENKFTAENIVNAWDEENLIAIIKGYGEEKYAKRIAQRIVEERKVKPIKTTKDLSEIIVSAYPAKDRYRKTHPATKTFQALRITVNDELEALKEGLTGIWQTLSPKGKLAVISFHSLEDRIVKRFFKELVRDKKGILMNKKPIIPDEREIKENPRSRSAKLRVIKKIND